MVEISRLMRGKSDLIYDDLDLLSDSRGNVFHARHWDGTRLRLVDVSMLPAGGSKSIAIPWLQWHEKAEGRGYFDPAPRSGLDAESFAAISDLEPHDIGEERQLLRRLSWARLGELVERSPKDRRAAVLEHGHLAYPLNAFVLLLFGLPLVIGGEDRNVFYKLFVCLFLSLAFFTFIQLMNRLGAQSDLLDPMLAAWLPAIVFGSIGILLSESRRSGSAPRRVAQARQ